MNKGSGAAELLHSVSAPFADMAPRLALFVLAVVALQGALASEDLDWGEPQTALWAIAREHDIVSDLVTEASAAVEQAVEEAKQKARATADAKFAEWLAPVEQFAAEKGVDLQASGCLDSALNKFGDVFYTINYAIKMCVVAGRARWDAKVRRLQQGVDGKLELIGKAQNQIERCQDLPGDFLTWTCYETKVSWLTLTAQDDKSKDVRVYWDVMNHAPRDIVNVTLDCLGGAFHRADFQVRMSTRDTTECVEEQAAMQP